MIEKKKALVISVIVVLFAVVALGISYWRYTSETQSEFIGIWDKVVGSDPRAEGDYVEFKADGTAFSFRRGVLYKGTWELTNSTTLVANYLLTPPNLIYTLNENGGMMGWRGDVYTKRVG